MPDAQRFPALLLSLALVACVSPPLDSPKPANNCSVPLRVPQNLRDKVDILFMVDNSGSMGAMSDELKHRFGQFFSVFDQLAKDSDYVDLQIGVVTSDFGAGLGKNSCGASPGGQRGRLQAIGQFADNGCRAPMGANFIKYTFTADGKGIHNLPPGQTLADTFTCMASVGSTGCGYEHQLESVYAALHDNLPENAGFLRDDALLVIVFLTNEDDSSAPPDTPMFEDGQAAEALYGYPDSFRSTRFGVMCGTPPSLVAYQDSGGPLANCQAATSPPGLEYPVSRYIDLFTKPAAEGGLKTNAADVILVGIDAPADPVQIILSNPAILGGEPYFPCGLINEGSTPPCVPVLQHSCQNPKQPVFFGDPAVRLNTVINAAPIHKIASICDSDYSGALADIGNLVVSSLKPGCVPIALADPINPDCAVDEATTHNDGTTEIHLIPACANGNGIYPCWSVGMRPDCGVRSPQSLGITIERNGKAAPPNTVARIECGSTC